MPKTRKHKRKNENEQNRKKTRKMSSDDDDIEYPIECIIAHIYQEGGGEIKHSSRIQQKRKFVQYCIDSFIELGWREDFVHNLFRNVYDRILSRYPLRLFVKEYTNVMIHRLDRNLSIRDSYIQLGLRPDIAVKLETILEPLREDSSYSCTQVLDTGILYLLGNFKPIAAPNVKHCIYPDEIESWLEYKNKSTLIYNLSVRCIARPYIITKFENALSKLIVPDNSSLYFHTTSWKSSFSILDRISRLHSRRCLDFGIFPGFYMSHTSNTCIEWGEQRTELWSGEVAIMIFCIPNTIPSHLSYKQLSSPEWVDVTKHSRRCNDDDDLESIRDIDLLYGDMVKNPTDVKYGGMPMSHSPPKKQLVSKSDAGDAFVHSCLIGAVYFQKIQ